MSLLSRAPRRLPSPAMAHAPNVFRGCGDEHDLFSPHGYVLDERLSVELSLGFGRISYVGAVAFAPVEQVHLVDEGALSRIATWCSRPLPHRGGG